MTETGIDFEEERKKALTKLITILDKYKEKPSMGYGNAIQELENTIARLEEYYDFGIWECILKGE